jgi:uncharacterized cupredoxin-like copper-binding protein
LIAYSLSARTGAAKIQTAPSSTAAPASSTSTGAIGTTVQVKGGEFFFKLSTRSIAKPGKVTFAFTNIGHVLHDFKIGGKQTPLTQPGKTVKLVVSFTKKGSFPYLCTVPGHAQAGMKGTFVVR